MSPVQNKTQETIKFENIDFSSLEQFANYIISLPETQLTQPTFGANNSKFVGYLEYIDIEFLIKTALTLESSTVLSVPLQMVSQMPELSSNNYFNNQQSVQPQISHKINLFQSSDSSSQYQSVSNKQSENVVAQNKKDDVENNQLLSVIKIFKKVQSPTKVSEDLMNDNKMQPTQNQNKEKKQGKLLTKDEYIEIDKKVMQLSDTELLAIAMANDIELYSSLGEGRIDAETFREQARKLARNIEIQKRQSKD